METSSRYTDNRIVPTGTDMQTVIKGDSTAQLVNRSEGMIKSSVFHAVKRIRAKVIS
ncbi:hypothetical protein [Paenibacillus illinoisensis]|uniref:hypothetical protein n=1 Tax=Paenibacillus illinoisensis TaxID=59845 RepID=UPI00301C87D0